MAYEKINYNPGDVLTADQMNKIQDEIINNNGNIESHIESTDNPHNITAEQIGARPDTWTPSAADVGALPNTGGNMSGAINMDSNKITNLATPTADTDASTKKYVDDGLGKKQNTITGAITPVLTSNFVTGRVIVSDSNGKLSANAITTNELSMLDGVTSNIQTQLDEKQDAITGLTSGMVMICNSSGKITTSSTVSTGELGYLDGVTSKIQTQLNGKAASSHNHAASEITSGTLSVDRGGTGVTTDGALGLKAYPIGSIYIAYNNTSPASRFGGTWTQIKDRFLLAIGSTYTSVTTGGAATVTLTTDQIPTHSHRAYGCTSANINGGTGKNVVFTGEDWANGDLATSSVGGGKSHNNMPPYQTVYMWRRTA